LYHVSLAAGGVWWSLAAALLAVYTLAIPGIGIAGILLLRDLGRRGRDL
jgi:hypothetical protein